MTGYSIRRSWYGVEITTLLCVLLYALGLLFVLLGPSQPAGSDGELVVKVLSLVATVVVALVLHVATAIYDGRSGAVSSAAEEIAAVDAVDSVHVVTDEYDAVVHLDLTDHDGLPTVVAEEIHPVTGVVETVTQVAFEH